MLFTSGSQSVPWISNLSLTWELVRMQTLRPHPDLLNQKPWEWRPEIFVLTSRLGMLMADEV